jgi:3'-5' exoribonuclease-like protein
VETSGSSFSQNGLLSIGASLQDQDSNELESFQVNVALPQDRNYEQRTLEEFWLKNPTAYEFVQQNPLLPKEAMDAFCEFLQRVEEAYPQLMVVSDNPSFDIAWLNLYLNLYTMRLPLNYSAQNEYRFIWDVHSMLKTLLFMKHGDPTSDWDLPA